MLYTSPQSSSQSIPSTYCTTVLHPSIGGLLRFYCWNQTLYNVHNRWKRPWICCHGGIGWPFILLKGTCQVNHARAPEKNTGDSSSMSDASKYDKTKWKKGSSVQELHRQAGFLGSQVPSCHRWHSTLAYLNYLIIQLTALAVTWYMAPIKIWIISSCMQFNINISQPSTRVEGAWPFPFQLPGHILIW